MQLKVQPTGVADHLAADVPPPDGGRGGSAVGAGHVLLLGVVLLRVLVLLLGTLLLRLRGLGLLGCGHALQELRTGGATVRLQRGRRRQRAFRDGLRPEQDVGTVNLVGERCGVQVDGTTRAVVGNYRCGARLVGQL